MLTQTIYYQNLNKLLRQFLLNPRHHSNCLVMKSCQNLWVKECHWLKPGLSFYALWKLTLVWHDSQQIFIQITFVCVLFFHSREKCRDAYKELKDKQKLKWIYQALEQEPEFNVSSFFLQHPLYFPKSQLQHQDWALFSVGGDGKI
jgi:hypothetical protein